MTLTAQTRTEIERHRDRYPQPRSAVLPSLWALQHEVGYLSVDGMREVAQILGLTPSEVQAVATFYSMYFDKPAGRHSALICRNVSCGLRGADDIVSKMEQLTNSKSGETTPDGEFTWEATIECLGACGGAPAMQIDHHFHENLTVDTLGEVLDGYRGTASPHGAAGHEAPVNGSRRKVAPETKEKVTKPRARKAKMDDANG